MCYRKEILTRKRNQKVYRKYSKYLEVLGRNKEIKQKQTETPPVLLVESELSIRTRATCHIHLGQDVPPGKTSKNSEKPMTASQVAWGKDHGDRQERCFWVRMSQSCPQKEAVPLLEVSGLCKTWHFSGARKGRIVTLECLCYPHWRRVLLPTHFPFLEVLQQRWKNNYQPNNMLPGSTSINIIKVIKVHRSS